MILWIVGLIVNFNLLAVRTGQSSGINLQVTRWRRLGLEGIWMFDFNPLVPHSWGKKKESWGTPPDPRQELLLHLFHTSSFMIWTLESCPSARPDAVTVQDLHCDALEMTPDPDSDS